MRKFFLMVTMLAFAAVAYAQTEEEYEFVDLSDEIEDVEVPPYEKKHYLGDKFTKMFFALKEQYVTSQRRLPSIWILLQLLKSHPFTTL